MPGARAAGPARGEPVADPAMLPVSLGSKLVLILTGVGLAGALAITLLLAEVITPSFDRLETRAIAGHVERAETALAAFAAEVEDAARDDGDRNNRAAPMATIDAGVQGIAYVAPDRRVAWARWRDDAGRGGEGEALRQALLREAAVTDIARTLRRRRSASFYARLGPVVAAVGVAQVRGRGATQVRRGWMVMARVLTDHQLSALLQLDARIAPPMAGQPVSSNRRWAAVAVPIMGVGGHAVAAARFSVPRDISLLGRRMLLLAVAGSTLLLLILLVMLRRIIDRLVLRPLARIEAHIQRVSASGSLNLLGDDCRRDEVGSLGRSLNAMLRQLHALREQIEVQSFQLGRSESAVAMMHNARNALNPISTILSLGLAQAPAIDRPTLDRALGELAAGELPAARRQKLVAFVAAAFESEGRAREDMQRDMGAGREAMAHVLEIIGQQQQRALDRPRLDDVDVGEVIARNAAIARYSETARIAFTLHPHRHLARANRVILSQVIGNLLGNAAEAIAATGRESGAITVSVVEVDGRVVIRIDDDGDGFAAGTGATLFQRGFSTRRHKTGGLGLHWCANSMMAMEGSLTVESAGEGRGATATLSLAAGEAPLLFADAA